MKARYPTFDFDEVSPRWSPNGEMAQHYNAASIVPSHIEPYLVRVMLRALPEVGKRNPELARDIELFNKQEVEHAKRHNAFNRMLRDKGYTGLTAFEKRLAGDYKRFFEKKSLKFNIAYSEGFEAIGSSNAETFFAVLPLLEKAADPEALALWKWHLAEEFEHRHVCYEVYRCLYGQGVTRGYFYRCYGYLYAHFHLSCFMKAVADYLIATDRAGMPPEKREKSKARVKRYRRMTLLRDLKNALAILSPFYDPSRKSHNIAISEYLKGI